MKIAKNSSPSPEAIAKVTEAFRKMDWDAYWRRVLAKQAIAVDQYAAARRRSARHNPRLLAA